MRKKGWIFLAIVSLLLFLVGQSYSTAERYVIWTEANNQLQMCASISNLEICKNIVWSDNQCMSSNTPCTTECTWSGSCNKRGQINNSEGICDQGFYSAWHNNPKCNCCSTNSEAISPGTHNTISSNDGKTAPTTSYNTLNCSPSSKLANTLGILVAALVVLLVLVIGGWVWTCWMVKKLRQQIKSSQTNNILLSLSAINSSSATTAYSNYENAQPGDTTSTQSTFQSSTEYSLLHPTTKKNSEMTATGEDSADIVNAEEYHKLDRGKERPRAKASAPWPKQRGGGGRPEDYSQLILD